MENSNIIHYNKPTAEEIKNYVKLSETLQYRQIYEQYYSKKYTAPFVTFSRNMANWKHKYLKDTKILDAANLAHKFEPYKSTVQVDKEGNVVQAWIKQNSNVEDYVKEILTAIKENVQPLEYEFTQIDDSNRMLEIPLFDMHFGLCDYNYYENTKNRILNIINKHYWDEIHFIVGQDLFHNDNFEGRTTKGTVIEKVNMQQAWNDAKQFYYELIIKSMNSSNKVVIHYSKGNHDKTIGWTFVQLLKALFPTLTYDDDLKPRKCIYWNGCFIGFGHCEYKRSKSKELFKQFIFEYPQEYAKSSIREIHSGHLHCESGEDDGIMIRRLPAGNKTDEWSSNNGFIGTHKRFMIFEYEPNFLVHIDYV